MKIINRLSSRYAKVTPLPAGTYHLQTTLEGSPSRLHLRLHEDGTGLLIVNASTVLQLNPTAAEYAYHLVQGSTPEQAAKEIAAGDPYAKAGLFASVEIRPWIWTLNNPSQ